MVSTAQSESQRHSIHPKLLRHIPQQKPLVVTFKKITRVEEEYEVRRSHSCLDEIVYFKGVLVISGHVLQLLELLQPVVQQTR